MNCPNCKVNLVMSDRNGVEIDYCPQCRGVWLDRGELDKIIERSTQFTANQPSIVQPGYHQKQQHSDSDYRYKKKKDSFLGDLFDF